MTFRKLVHKTQANVLVTFQEKRRIYNNWKLTELVKEKNQEIKEEKIRLCF